MSIAKVYTLPDLTPAPTSDIGTLARQLIEYADIRCVRPLIDALKEAGRENDAAILKHTVATYAKGLATNAAHWSNDGWRTVCESSLLAWLWFDLFDFDATLAVIDNELKKYRPKTQFSEVIGHAARSYSYNPETILEVQVAPGQSFGAGDPVGSDSEGRAINLGNRQSIMTDPVIKEWLDNQMSQVRKQRAASAANDAYAQELAEELSGDPSHSDQTPSQGSPDPSDHPEQG